MPVITTAIIIIAKTARTLRLHRSAVRKGGPKTSSSAFSSSIRNDFLILEIIRSAAPKVNLRGGAGHA